MYTGLVLSDKITIEIEELMRKFPELRGLTPKQYTLADENARLLLFKLTQEIPDLSNKVFLCEMRDLLSDPAAQIQWQLGYNHEMSLPKRSTDTIIAFVLNDPSTLVSLLLHIIDTTMVKVEEHENTAQLFKQLLS
jgi:hypothetical protein